MPPDSLNPLISDKHEVEELASELANHYVDYLSVDISFEEKKLEDSIDECLAHLEEVCSSTDNCKQNSNDISQFVQVIADKNAPLEKLYSQIDALEQYMFETNKLLDQLDNVIDELENYKSLGGNKIKWIVDMIPKLPFRNIPRLGLLNSFGGLLDESSPSISGMDLPNEQSLAPISDLLSKVSHISESFSATTKNLHTRLHGELGQPKGDHFADSLNLERTDEQVDGSWQELL